MTVPEPLEHSGVGEPIEVGNSSGDIVTISERYSIRLLLEAMMWAIVQ